MNASDVAQWLLAAGGVAGVTGGLVAAFQSRATRRKIDAEAAKLDADSEHVITQRANTVNAMALGLLEPMEHRIRELTAEVDQLRQKVHTLSDQIAVQRNQITMQRGLLSRHGIPLPPWPES